MRPIKILAFFVNIVLLQLTSPTSGSPGGAPLSTCDDMMPHHADKLPQETSSPYQVLPSKGQGRIRLIIGSNDGLGYEGFIVVARDVDTGKLIGEFGIPGEDMARHLECTPGVKNAVTHIKPQKIHNLELDWEAPADYEGTIVFNTTICKTWDVFWVGVESPRISVDKRSIEILSTTSTYLFPRVTTPPYFLPTTESTVDAIVDEFYDGCGMTKNCFGTPDRCVEQKNCMAVVSVLVKGERYIFEMQSRNNAKYVAVGLSEDDKMGDDAVVECVAENDNRVSVHTSWNNGKQNTRLPKNETSAAIELISSSSQDGSIKCKYSRNKLTTVQGMQFDLVNKPYHLLVAIGSELKANSIGYHDLARSSSSEPRLMSDVGDLKSSSQLLTRIHGALMIASWLGTASVGMILARYYRQTWLSSQLCGKDHWFAWHRIFMFLTWSMSIAAAIIIFIEIGGISVEVYHRSFGIATNVLCFVQPFMALMRPHPGAPKRALFNWMHWLVGNAAHICGIIAIFFAVRLTKAKLPGWLDWILVGYVAFHVITHLFLTFAGCASDRQGSQRVNSFPMKDVHGRNSLSHTDIKRDAPGARLRKLIFGIYFLVVVVIAAVIILIIVFAPIADTWRDFIKIFKND